MRTSLSIIAICLFLIFIVSSFAFAEEEELSITTYYPSPYGVYKNLRLYPNDDNTPGTACTNEGETYYDNSDHALYICSNNRWTTVPGATGGIPSGMIAMFATTCPTGWTRFSALDAKFPRGSATYGGTSGSSTHTHTATITQGCAAILGGYWITGNCPTGLTNQSGLSYAQAAPQTISNESSLPSYLNVIWCKKD